MAADPFQPFIDSIAQIRTIAVIFLILIVASVAVRMYVRLFMTKKFHLEDWAMVVTFLVSVGHISMAIAVCQLALQALHNRVGTTKTSANLLKASGVTYVVNLITLKISLGCFFLNIFTYQRPQRIAIYAIMSLSTVLGFVYAVIGNFTCAELKPLPGTNTECRIQHTSSVLLVIFSVINIVGDFAFVLMAIVALWAAQLPRVTKLSTIVLLCLGSTGSVASVVRLVLCVTPTTIANYSKTNLNLLQWILIELGFGVVATNLALTRPLFHAVLTQIDLTKLSFGSGNSSKSADAFSDGRQDCKNNQIPLVGSETKTMTVVTLEEEGSGQGRRRGLVLK